MKNCHLSRPGGHNGVVRYCGTDEDETGGAPGEYRFNKILDMIGCKGIHV